MTRIFTSGVFDLFHFGHLSALKKAKSQGDYLLVGLCSDEETERYKRRPIISLAQRIDIVSSIDCVDEAFESPSYLTEDFYLKHRIDIHCQGDCVLDFYELGEQLGIMKYVGREESIDTSQIIQTILEQNQ